MSDEPVSSPDTSPEQPVTQAAPKARRVSTPRAKKVAKTEAVAGEDAPVVEPGNIPRETEIPAVASGRTPATPESQEEKSEESEGSADSSHGNGEWPEAEAAVGGGQGDSSKRKRRRRKGKGQSSGAVQVNPPVSGSEEAPTASSGEARPPEGNRDSHSRPQGGGQQPQVQRSKIDPEQLAKSAWKIFLAEVSEEGVALIGDNDAKDLARRCFRLAEIFIEEQSRRR